MKCRCETCRGTGEVPCPECEGKGGWFGPIEHIDLDSSMPHYNELLELKKDAQRCINLAQRLVKLKPERESSYNEQLKACLQVINQQADRLHQRLR